VKSNKAHTADEMLEKLKKGKTEEPTAKKSKGFQ